MKKVKKILLFGTLFVLLDCLLVSGTALGIMLYDYFSHRELLALYQSKYGLTLMLSLSFALSTMVCAVLFGVGYTLYKKMPSIKASKIWGWLKENVGEANFSEYSAYSVSKDFITGNPMRGFDKLHS